MPSIRYFQDPCPCGSGLKVFECCIKSCGNLLPKVSNTSYSHQKCYAREFANCSSKISGEHWISENILKCIEPIGPIIIGGLPWVAPGECQSLPIEGMQSKVLCESHNHALSDLDRTAGRFFSSWPSVKARRSAAKSIELFCGLDFERWLLKSLCGGISSGVLNPPLGRLKGWRPPVQWLKYLYEGIPWPSGMGLYLAQQAGDLVQSVNPVEIACISNGAEVYGGIVRLHGFRFILALVPPTNPLPSNSLLSGASYRPSAIDIAGTSRITLLFDWGPAHKGDQFNIRFTPR